MTRPRVFYTRWLPSAKAITAPPFGIFIKKQFKGVRSILIHEVTHWRQYLRMGLLKFYFNYFKEGLTYSYEEMPMEKEAETRESVYKRFKSLFRRKNKRSMQVNDATQKLM